MHRPSHTRQLQSLLAPSLVLLCLALSTTPGCGDDEPSGPTPAADAVDQAADGPEAGVEDTASPGDAADEDADVAGDSSADAGPPDPCQGTVPVRSPAGIGWWDACPEAYLRLLPAVWIEGASRGAGDDGECDVNGFSVICPAGDAGRVWGEWLAGGSVAVHFEADRDVLVEALELRGEGRVDGATSWISNGFQSWSQSGLVALGGPPTGAALQRALAARGDEETLRRGTELSWFFTLVGGGGPSLVAGALSAERFKPWIQVSRAGSAADDPGRLAVRLVSGGAGETVPVSAGDTLDGPHWHVELGGSEVDPNELLGRYGALLPRRLGGRPPETGWNSWYDLWDGVDESAVRANSELAASTLGPHLPDDAPPLRIVVDDGWQMGWGDWWPNEKFPSGLDGLASDLHDAGYEVGVWLAPFLVEADSTLALEHPDWLVGDAFYEHAKIGRMAILDVTHPEAAAHLRATIERLVGWGYDLLKIDFLFAGTFEGERHQDVTGMEAFHRGMQIIREAAGSDTVLLGVGTPPVASFIWVDGWRLGADIALEPFGPSWPFVANQARSLAVRWPLCQAVLCDTEPALLRALPRNEVEAGSWVAAMGGGAFFLSDDLRDLDAERREWGLDAQRLSLGIGGTPAVPESPFGVDPPDELTTPLVDLVRREVSQVVPLVWQLPDGGRLLLNVTDELVTTEEGLEVPPHSAVRGQ